MHYGSGFAANFSISLFSFSPRPPTPAPRGSMCWRLLNLMLSHPCPTSDTFVCHKLPQSRCRKDMAASSFQEARPGCEARSRGQEGGRLVATMGLWAPCAGALRLGRCSSGGCCPPALPTLWAETQELRVHSRTWPLEGLHADGFTSPVTAGSLLPPQRPGLHRLQPPNRGQSAAPHPLRPQRCPHTWPSEGQDS